MKTLAKKLALLFLSLFVVGQTVVITYAINIDELLPNNLEHNIPNQATEEDRTHPQLDAYNKLPDVSLTSAVTNVIRTMLYIAGSLFVIGALVSGVMYLAGTASEEFTNKAKKNLGYLGLGIIILSTSYAIVSGLLQLNLFD